MGQEFRNQKSRQHWIKTFKKLGSVTKATNKCGISRSTLYRWVKRNEEGEIESLASRSKKPKKLANLKISSKDERNILKLRDKFKWGPQRIFTHLLRENNINLSPSTIWRILKKYNVKSVKKYGQHSESSNLI